MHITTITLYIDDVKYHSWKASTLEIAVCRFNNEIYDILRRYAHSEEDVEYIKSFNYDCLTENSESRTTTKVFQLDNTDFDIVTTNTLVHTEYPQYEICMYKNGEVYDSWYGSNIRTLLKVVNGDIKSLTLNSQWSHVYKIEYSKIIDTSFTIGDDKYDVQANFEKK